MILREGRGMMCGRRGWRGKSIVCAAAGGQRGINMKTIRVAAAIIKKTNEKGEPVIFATQRGYGDFKG